MIETGDRLVGVDALRNIALLIRPVRERLFDVLGLQPGDRCLDVGCGVGLDTLMAARAIGPSGLVFGIDQVPLMVSEAERLASSMPVGRRPRHGIGDAVRLPFPSSAFDVVYSDRVLQHVPSALAVLQEMAR